MADIFADMVSNLERMGFFQFLFPFLLAFAIMYGVLNWVFGKDKLGGPRVQALISVLFSFFVMLYSATNAYLVGLLTTVSGVWLGMATIILAVVVLSALAGVNIHEVLTGEKRNWIKYLIFLVIIYIFLAGLFGTGGPFSSWLPYWIRGSDLWTVLLVVIIIAVVFWFVGGGGEEAAKKEPEKKV